MRLKDFLFRPRFSLRVLFIVVTVFTVWLGVRRLTKTQIGSKAGELWTANGLSMKFHWCPPGRFTMGSPETEEYRDYFNEDQVAVTLSQGFWIGETEVTQRQWRAVMQTTLWRGEKYVKEGDDYAATFVSWEDAVKFCVEFTRRERAAGRLPTGWSYQLPTEAQWEYACRAGTRTAYSFGGDPARLGAYAWFDENAGDIGEKYAHEVGQKKANSWGLYDMHGNVSEWCRDWHHVKLPGGTDPDKSAAPANYRVLRGGGWDSWGAGSCRLAYRLRCTSRVRYHSFGFRLALVQSGRATAGAERAKPGTKAQRDPAGGVEQSRRSGRRSKR